MNYFENYNNFTNYNTETVGMTNYKNYNFNFSDFTFANGVRFFLFEKYSKNVDNLINLMKHSKEVSNFDDAYTKAIEVDLKEYLETTGLKYEIKGSGTNVEIIIKLARNSFVKITNISMGAPGTYCNMELWTHKSKLEDIINSVKHITKNISLS